MFQKQKIMGHTGKFKRGLTYVKPLFFVLVSNERFWEVFNQKQYLDIQFKKSLIRLNLNVFYNKI